MSVDSYFAARGCVLSVVLVALASAQDPIDVASRLEIFADPYLIGELKGAALKLHPPLEEGLALRFDKPWEGPFCGYVTVIRDGGTYRAYYRGLPVAGADGSDREVTCYAESRDGIAWTKPSLGLFEAAGTRENNVILAGLAPFSHNFCPMLDARPGVPPSERFKAVAGTGVSGLVAFASQDGIRWRKLRDEPVFRKGAFDSQNVPFWSGSEGCYLLYFRVFVDGVRRISRTTSQDFLSWTDPILMQYGDRPIEHLYTNQTSPYFRAPHTYVSVAARFLPGRKVISGEEAKAIGVHPSYYGDCSDGVLMTTRGGDRYDRTFMEGFIRPGIGLEDWVSRTNYPALNVVPTGPAEMSLYVQKGYGQPSARLVRYSLRTDGFASVSAPYAGGEMTTKPLRFQGKELIVNFGTSAAGGMRVEVQDAAGKPIGGYALADSVETIGNEVERAVRWKAGSDVSALAGRPVRLRFALKDADLYSIAFRP